MIKKAFTLPEVLITLGIIGVIAALSIPQMVISQQAQQAKSRFNTAYSMISKAVSDMESDEISTNARDYSTADSFYDVFKNYFKVTIDCGKHNQDTNSSVCVSSKEGATNDNNYLTKKGNVKMNHAFLDNGAFVANNGMLFMIENSENNPYGLLVSVDINGKNKRPNRWGWDLFTFEIKDGDVIPVGDKGTKYEDWENNPENYCNNTSDSNDNGITCSSIATTEKEYFKKTYGSR